MAAVGLLAVACWVAQALLLVHGLLHIFRREPVPELTGISLRQAVTPPELMGRMTAGMRTLMWGLGTLGALVGGFPGGLLGLRELPSPTPASAGSQ